MAAFQNKFTEALRKIKPPGFDGLSIYDVLSFLRRQLTVQDLTEQAAAISYNLVMAIPPSLLFLFTIIPHLPFFSSEKHRVRHQLNELIKNIIPAKEYNGSIISFIDNFMNEPRFGLLSFGLLASLFFSSNAIMGIMRSFRRDSSGFRPWKGIPRRMRAIKLTAILYALLIGYITLLIMQGKFLKLIITNYSIQKIIMYSRWFFIVLLVHLSIAFIYRFAPSLKVKWKFMNPGSVLATILCLLSSIAFSLFVNNFGRYNALYGAIGTVMMVMALIFINSLVLLIGFELNVSIQSLKAGADDALAKH